MTSSTVRIVAYFAGWLIALPGLALAVFFLAIDHAVAVGNLIAVAWEALLAFLYGLPLAALVALVTGILGFFRMGRIIGAGMLLVAALGAIAVILELAPGPPGADEWFFVLPTAAGAALAGWLLFAETRDTSSPAASPTASG